MSLLGKLHPLLLHFPIGLVLAAAAAEFFAILTRRRVWRAVAIANLRAGAAMAFFTAVAGWEFASATFVEPGRLLEWHRWVGVSGATASIGAALASARLETGSRRWVLVYRGMLFMAAAVISVAGHTGGTLVWGVDFLRP